jgi:hypothetical protein
MPDRDVRTLRDLIWYQYAKIIARRALGPEAKREHYGFVMETLRDLQSARKQWTDISREDWQLVESEKRCVYWASSDRLSRGRETLLPRGQADRERRGVPRTFCFRAARLGGQTPPDRLTGARMALVSVRETAQTWRVRVNEEGMVTV